MILKGLRQCTLKTVVVLGGILCCLAAVPAQAQMPADTKFIDGIRDRNYAETLPYMINGGSPDVRDFNGMPALVVAADINDAGMVAEMLKYGANPNISDRDTGETALMRGAARGNEMIVRLLAAAGADLNRENDRGETALIKAVQAAKVDTIKALLELNADLEFADYTGNSAYDHAMRSRNPRVKSLLKDAVAEN